MIPERPRAGLGSADAETLDTRGDDPPARTPPAAASPSAASIEAVDPRGRSASAGMADTVARAVTTTTTSEPRLLGARVGRYVLLSKLGEGGMGEVYSGYDEELDRRVALKVVRARLADSTGRARMQREAQALARLSHPNVVQIHDVGEIDGQLFVAMEYVRGETLRAFQGRHDPATAAGRRAILDMYLQAGRGLAAAHDAGIVHRDFKPDNVLVGDDGRARVLDFGLAAERRALAVGLGDDLLTTDDGSGSGSGGILDSDLTRTGSILGTPAYMAPEQFLAQAVDPRTDLFAFSVALYDALHGEMPFAGETVATRQAAVVSGALREAPASARVPPWLRAVIVRGLAREPGDRHPTMEAMLRALADDPIARRRRRWRLVGLCAAAVVVAAALIVAGLWGWERWQQARAEARASERLQAAEARIDALLADGAAAEAERVFTTFATHEEHRGTAALGRAWLHRAERARDRGEGEAAIDAFAAAYTVATSPADQTTALVGLARLFRVEMRWPGLFLALAALEARGVDEAGAPELAELRLDAALARRDLPGAISLLRGPMAGSPRAAAAAVLDALRPATMTVHHHHGWAAVADLDGDGRLEVVLETNARDRQIAPLLRADPELSPIGTLDLGRGSFRALSPGPGEPALLISSEWAGPAARLADPRATEAVARRLEGGAFREVLRWPESSQVLSALAADLDGDGERELLVGMGPYARRVFELSRGTGDAEGAWTVRPAAPAIERRRSDVVELLADDLDGDGRVEVVAALGPWTAYELQVLRHDPGAGALQTVSRRRLGNIAGAALSRRGPGGVEVVVSKTDEYPSTVVFPRDRPHGDPAGTYFFRLEGDALVESGFVPHPRLGGDARVLDGRPLIADLDGDGRDEVILCRAVTDVRTSIERDVAVILVRGDDGAWIPSVLGDLRPIAALDLDGDGDDELIASRSDAEDRDRVWVLGAGDAALPTLQPERPGQAIADDPRMPRDPALARMWRHADEIARMGLSRQAAAGLTTLADLVGEPEVRAEAEARAAALLESLGADAEAAALHARAAAEPSHAGRAHVDAARLALRLGRIDDAVAHLEGAERRGGAPPAELVADVAALRGGPRIDLDFARPLASPWRIDQPLALRRDGARGALHVDGLVDGELLSAPVRWSGGSLVLEVDLDLARLEWRSGLEIGLMGGETGGLRDGVSPLGVDFTTTGGGTSRAHHFACMSYGQRGAVRIPFEVGEPGDRLGRLTIRAVLLPALGEWSCTVTRASGEVLGYSRHPLGERREPPAALRLAIAATGAPAWSAADLHRLQITGASLEVAGVDDPSADAAAIEARRALVEGDPLAALGALEAADVGARAAPRERLLQVVALAHLGRWREAEAALGPLLRREDAPFDVALRGLLRSDPEVFGALVRGAAGAAEVHLRLEDAWSQPLRMEQDPRGYAVILAGLADRDLERDPFLILRAHAVAAAGLGHLAAADASYRAALVALDDPARHPEEPAGWAESERAAIRIELAAIAIEAGDEATARRELAPFVVGDGADLFLVDRLRAREDLRALWDLLPGGIGP